MFFRVSSPVTGSVVVTLALSRPSGRDMPSGRVIVAVKPKPLMSTAMVLPSGLPNWFSMPPIWPLMPVMFTAPVRSMLVPAKAGYASSCSVLAPERMSDGRSRSNGLGVARVSWIVLRSAASLSLPSSICAPVQMKEKSFSVPAAEVATASKVPVTVPTVVSVAPSATSSFTVMPGTVSFMVSASRFTASCSCL